MPQKARPPPAHRGRVVAPRVLLGSKETVNDDAFLAEHAVTHLLCCAREVPEVRRHSKLVAHRVELEETMGVEIMWPLFRDAVRWGADAHAVNGTLLVYCRRGLNRSVATLCGVLMQVQDVSAEEALSMVLQVQPNALPQPALRECLRKLEAGEPQAAPGDAS